MIITLVVIFFLRCKLRQAYRCNWGYSSKIIKKKPPKSLIKIAKENSKDLIIKSLLTP